MSEKWFKKGTIIEVTSDEEGLRGVWYVAKIIETPKYNRCVVEYDELVTAENDTEKLIERVHVSSIRPLPPVGNDEVIDLNDVVDAFHKDGWWTGVVHEVGDGGDEFVVCFDDPPDKIVCKRGDLRLHFDWLCGKWEKPQKKEDANTVAMLSNNSENAKRQKRRAKKQAGKDSASTGHAEIVEKECIAEVDISIKEVKGALSAKNCETPLKNYQKKRSRDQPIITVDDSNTLAISNNFGNAKRQKRRAEKQAGKDCASTGCAETVEKECIAEKVDISVKVLNGALSAKKCETSLKKYQKKRSRDQKINTVDSTNASTEGDNSSMTKWGRSKLLSKKQIECLREILQTKDTDMLIDRIVGDINDDQVSNSSLQLDKQSLTGSHNSRALPVQPQCANANARQDDFGTPPVAKRDRMDPSPLQKTDGPNPEDLPVKNLNRADSNDKGGELEIPSSSVSIDNVENVQNLPFVKGSPLWKTVESMEIYKKMAQKPHFSPLVNCSEVTREGWAIAHMVNFSNLVEKTSKLQFRDPITTIESGLKTLEELESHGFNVETVRACLTQLLSKKQKAEELQKEYQDIRNEKAKVDEEITELNQEITELATKLGEAVSRKEIKKSVISTLQSEQEEVGENVQSLQLEFESITSSLC